MIGLNKTFYHQTVTTEQIENYISLQAGFNFSKVFDQYLRTTQIPKLVLQYDTKEQTLSYEWKNCIKGFNLPIHINYLQGPPVPDTTFEQVKLFNFPVAVGVATFSILSASNKPIASSANCAIEYGPGTTEDFP